jgi:hypothetical protein
MRSEGDKDSRVTAGELNLGHVTNKAAWCAVVDPLFDTTTCTR